MGSGERVSSGIQLGEEHSSRFNVSARPDAGVQGGTCLARSLAGLVGAPSFCFIFLYLVIFLLLFFVSRLNSGILIRQQTPNALGLLIGHLEVAEACSLFKIKR